MISKRVTKYIKSLQKKKFRKQQQAFLVEGAKSVVELLQSDFEVTTLAGTPVFLKEIENLSRNRNIEVYEASEVDLSSLGTFQTNNSGIAIAKIKPNIKLNIEYQELAIGLDDVRDPGNLGTIIRIADWYGIKKIICSESCAEFYNPKVISASMGSFTRVQLFYTDLRDYVQQTAQPVYGAFLNGENIHGYTFRQKGGLIIMGNESAGISANLGVLIKNRISIPKFGAAESLNVAIATAIICDNFRR